MLRIAAEAPLEPVWLNEIGGVTFRMETARETRYLKWQPGDSSLLLAEAARLRWAEPFGLTPRLVDQGDEPEGSWLLTEGIPGLSAVAAEWKADPVRAVMGIGSGLRQLHDALPVGSCPFDWSTGVRLRAVRRRLHRGELQPERWHRQHRHLSQEAALALLSDPPPPDLLVVCHGDACAPNTILDGRGRCAGHVDLGALGVADRWADLAIAAWSTEWNYGPGLTELLLRAYGVEPDERRSAYYRLLWDAAD